MSPRPGRITHVVDVDLGARPRRPTPARTPAFFKKITEVREALRGSTSTSSSSSAPAGVEDR